MNKSLKGKREHYNYSYFCLFSTLRVVWLCFFFPKGIFGCVSYPKGLFGSDFKTVGNVALF